MQKKTITKKRTVQVFGILCALTAAGVGYVRAQTETSYREAKLKYELAQNSETIQNVVDVLEKAPVSHAVVRDVSHMAISRGPDEIDGATSMGITQMMLQEKIVNQNEKLIAQNERLISLQEKEINLLTQIAKKK